MLAGKLGHRRRLWEWELTKRHHPVPRGIRHVSPLFVLRALFALSSQTGANAAHDLALEGSAQLGLVALLGGGLVGVLVRLNLHAVPSATHGSSSLR